MLSRKRRLFAYPTGPVSPFAATFRQVALLPLRENGTALSAEATYDFNVEALALTCRARTLQAGADGQPVIVYLPWYGGKSARVNQIFGDRRHKGWTRIGIDIFHSRQDFDKILGSVSVPNMLT